MQRQGAQPVKRPKPHEAFRHRLRVPLPASVLAVGLWADKRDRLRRLGRSHRDERAKHAVYVRGVQAAHPQTHTRTTTGRLYVEERGEKVIVPPGHKVGKAAPLVRMVHDQSLVERHPKDRPPMDLLDFHQGVDRALGGGRIEIRIRFEALEELGVDRIPRSGAHIADAPVRGQRATIHAKARMLRELHAQGSKPSADASNSEEVHDARHAASGRQVPENLAQQVVVQDCEHACVRTRTPKHVVFWVEKNSQTRNFFLASLPHDRGSTSGEMVALNFLADVSGRGFYRTRRHPVRPTPKCWPR